MANLSPEQFNRPGTGYAPDVKRATAGETHFFCDTCGSHYVAPVRLDPAIAKLTSCRNLGCPGAVIRK